MSRHLLFNERRHRPLRIFARAGGFTFVELVVALGIAAAVITTAVIVYGTVSRSDSRLGTYGPVTLPTGTLQTLYGGGIVGNVVEAYFAPNYGRTEQAELLRESLYDDVAHASAVFCLARTGLSSATYRPLTIPISSLADGRQWDSAEAFRILLEGSPSPVTFSSYRGKGTARNLSIFIISPSQPTDKTHLTVKAIYELDFVAATSPAGTYVSVRRFEGTGYTDAYDIFYPASTLPTAFLPTVVQFERSARLVTAEDSTTVDPFKVAANRPFYFVWWPDPGMRTLEGSGTFATYPAGDPRSAYAGMSDRTSFFMVLPMFPSL